MPFQSVLPPEAYLEEQEPMQTVCKACPYGFVDCATQPDGKLRITRIISTDPAAYLDPRMAPGQEYHP